MSVGWVHPALEKSSVEDSTRGAEGVQCTPVLEVVHRIYSGRKHGLVTMRKDSALHCTASALSESSGKGTFKNPGKIFSGTFHDDQCESLRARLAVNWQAKLFPNAKRFLRVHILNVHLLFP